ncbi:MAG TPA: hypothetical protein VD902_18320 [Symbiobacteriaceae bacterium]|nr:hypothetical protein [Symbiobacteriaceae bacterium]
MIRRWLGLDRPTVSVTITGVVGGRMVRWEGKVRTGPGADVAAALAAAGKAADIDLLGALAGGAQPAVLLDGRRLELPQDLHTTVETGARLSWLMPMAGG